MKAAEKIDKHALYESAFCNTLKDISYKPSPTVIRKLIFYGVKMISTEPKPEYITEAEAARRFQLAQDIKTLIGTLTPAEFTQIFPIEKSFDGDKCGIKDYFYTREFIRSLPRDEPIGDVEAVSCFCWEYHNREVCLFLFKTFGYADDLCRLKGQPTALDLFCEDNQIKAFSLFTDSRGKQFMIDGKTGKVSRARKAVPRYLKLIK